jgi:hypothetical protein
VEKENTQNFKFEIGDTAYIKDSIYRISRSIFRVEILNRFNFGFGNIYQCKEVNSGDYPIINLKEEVLNRKPHAAKIKKGMQDVWLQRRGIQP